MVDRDHAHVGVRHIGAHIEVAQSVEAGRGVVEVFVYVSVEHEAELRTPLPEGRRGRRSWDSRCLSGQGIIGRRLLNGGRTSQEKPKDQSRAERSLHDTPLPYLSVPVES